MVVVKILLSSIYCNPSLYNIMFGYQKRKQTIAEELIYKKVCI